MLAKSVSPRELLEWAEANDAGALADAIEVPKDRALRAIAALRESNLGLLATMLVEDEAQFSLLDGTDYKAIPELSTGQRCTVVLPIVLERKDTVLIVDQPEDHIDNAFIVDTLIKSIRDRAKGSQLIVSTHNANIPVLGNAEKITQLGSDGRRGHVLLDKPLEDAATVAAISNVMEGGAEAFRLRAKFYRSHQAK